ncbi:MAG TPA: ShlB/FhaC/HecB family hemolysin secretion/activation protein [Cellvibrio sp.]|nr:ShlB/FhaC/HecB family hemolysin secretion/activation protein [Cellvibrio sp.]
MRVLALTTLALFSIFSEAQEPDTSGNQELLRQQERDRVLHEQQSAAPDVRLQVPPTNKDGEYLPTNESPCFIINTISLSGEYAEKFQWALAAADKASADTEDKVQGRCLGGQGINLVMKRIQNAMVANGFVTTRILAGPQDLKTGTLALTLVPGRVGQIQFQNSPYTQKWNALPIREEKLLNLRDIEQALENIRRVPSLNADIQIMPGSAANAKPGESDIIIKTERTSSYRLNAAVDDSGSDATGKYQGSLTLSLDHWWSLNDLFYLTLNRDLGGGDPGNRGSQGYNVYYSIPLSYWLFSLTTSSNDYHQEVAGAFESYNYSGESQNSDISVSRLIYRDAVRKTTLALHGWSRASKNFINDAEVGVQRRQMAGWQFDISHREFMGQKVLDFALNYRQGTGAFGSLKAPEENFDEGTARPIIISASTQVSVPWSVGEHYFNYSGSIRAQQNNTPLVPQDRFSIGGRYTVRGFDGESTLLAERGWLLRNDMGWRIFQTGQQLYMGIDYGSVSGPSSESLVGTHLSGAVLGLRGGYKSLSYDIFIGQPLEKPAGFRTSANVTGFSANWAY